MGNDAGDDEIGDAQDDDDVDGGEPMENVADDAGRMCQPAPGHACLTRRPEDLVDARSSMRRLAQPSHALACVWPAPVGLRT